MTGWPGVARVGRRFHSRWVWCVLSGLGVLAVQPGAGWVRSRVRAVVASSAQGAWAERWSRTRRPVVARRPAIQSRRRRSRLGSHRRAAWVVRARVCIQAADLAGEGDQGAPDLVLGEVVQRQVGQAGVFRAPDAVLA